MKKVSTILLALITIASLFFASCGDEEYEDLEFYPYALHGYIKDYHTGQPVANVSFNISCGSKTVGMQLPSTSYSYEGVAKTDSKGYYRIRIPKGNKNFSFEVINIRPMDNANYNFTVEEFDCKSFDTSSKRIDIYPISYGFVKIVMPKEASWNMGGITDSYDFPRYKTKFIGSFGINYTMKYDFYKVAATEGWGSCYYNNTSEVYDFIVEKPRDTIVINLVKK
ncbi:MAG: hypothetical protein H6Q15_2129 [Bacteroidetes bacterium]|nr:hypothetical protein [Bacteroidota bacterium]